MEIAFEWPIQMCAPVHPVSPILMKLNCRNWAVHVKSFEGIGQSSPMCSPCASAIFCSKFSNAVVFDTPLALPLPFIHAALLGGWGIGFGARCTYPIQKLAPLIALSESEILKEQPKNQESRGQLNKAISWHQSDWYGLGGVEQLMLEFLIIDKKIKWFERTEEQDHRLHLGCERQVEVFIVPSNRTLARGFWRKRTRRIFHFHGERKH